jgi:hypothetical protein
MIGLIYSERGFFNDWVKICQNNNIQYKVVYIDSNNLIDEIKVCDHILWNWYHDEPFNSLFSKKINILLSSHYNSNIYPDIKTIQTYDDKLLQKYIFELYDIKHPNTDVFYKKEEALDYLNKTKFPLIFKLSSGAGSYNVKKINNLIEGKKIIIKSFGKGFKKIDRYTLFKDAMSGIDSFYSKLKAFYRLFYKTEFEKVSPREKKYVIFQEFMPNNSYDIRIVVIYNKAIGFVRYNRKNDFRASGSGFINFDVNLIPESVIRDSFKISKKLQTQTLALDFLVEENNHKVIEVSYAFSNETYLDCQGYWNEDIKFTKSKIKIAEWILNGLIK